ncbi:MAG TPA: TetR/AcrR family transcriptional regulator [Acidimicrobiales bacterium]|nr:TetR/AcrR family transcriptional regulator [Acidimicrobiales bacterium]
MGDTARNGSVSGRPMLSQAFILDMRRIRVTHALAELCTEQGYHETSVTDIVARAGMARNSFYEVFPNRQETLLALFKRASAELTAEVDHACAKSPEEIPGLERALGAALVWVADNPHSARALLVEAPMLPAAHWCRLDFRAGLAERLARAMLGPGAEAEAREEMLIGGICAVLRGRLLRGEEISPASLREELMGLIELSYGDS